VDIVFVAFFPKTVGWKRFWLLASCFWYESENLKRGDRKKKSCPYAKMEKIKEGRTKKIKSYPCMKMKISKGGTEKKTSCPYAKMKKIKKGDGRKTRGSPNP
jgi:hypothetical protein